MASMARQCGGGGGACICMWAFWTWTMGSRFTVYTVDILLTHTPWLLRRGNQQKRKNIKLDEPAKWVAAVCGVCMEVNNASHKYIKV